MPARWRSRWGPWRPRRWPDHLVMTLSVLGFSVPAFVVGYVLIALRGRSALVAGPGLCQPGRGTGPVRPTRDAACPHLDLGLCGVDRADDPGQHAGGSGRGLYPHGPCQGRERGQGSAAPCPAQCRSADRHRDRDGLHPAAVGDGGDRKRVQRPRDRTSDHRCGGGAGRSGDPGHDPRFQPDLRLL